MWYRSSALKLRYDKQRQDAVPQQRAKAAYDKQRAEGAVPSQRAKVRTVAALRYHSGALKVRYHSGALKLRTIAIAGSRRPRLGVASGGRNVERAKAAVR